jgi:hypothetical protein
MSPSHDRSVTEVTFIRKLKRPDGSAVWPAYHLGEDRFGTWLFTPKGSLYRGERAGAAAYCNVGSPVGRCGGDAPRPSGRVVDRDILGSGRIQMERHRGYLHPAPAGRQRVDLHRPGT